MVAAPFSATGVTAFQRHMLALINAERAQAGAPALAWHPKLALAADEHSDWMLRTDTFSHDRPDATVRQQIDAAGYGWTTIGQNIGYQGGTAKNVLDFADVQSLHDGYMNSTPHRTSILNAAFSEIGIGLRTGDFTGYTTFISTQDFGAPNAAERADVDPAYPNTAVANADAAVEIGGTGPHALLLLVSGYQYQDNPTFTVSLDGVRIGAAQTATVLHGTTPARTQAFLLRGDFTASGHHLALALTNDASGGTSADSSLARDLYVDGVYLDGVDAGLAAQVTTATAIELVLPAAGAITAPAAVASRPGAPGNLLAGTPTPSSASLTWTAPDKGGFATRYLVEYRPDGGAWTTASQAVTGTAYTVAALAAGTAHEFRVSGVNGTGQGAASAVAAGSTAAAITPSGTTGSATAGTGLSYYRLDGKIVVDRAAQRLIASAAPSSGA